jgi:hypothetical protein
VNVRVSIDFACGGLKYFCLHALCQTKHIYRAMYARFCGLYRVELVMNGARWTSEVVYLVNFNVQGKRDIVAFKLKVGICEQMGDVALAAGEEIIDAQHVMTGFQ